ncbi:hypothetical protein HN51_062019, partial [Arachis hypogaea]
FFNNAYYARVGRGTALVVLAKLVAALKLVGGNLVDHRFLFLGAGEADGLLLGFPTRFGLMVAQFKAFLDATGGLWRT